MFQPISRRTALKGLGAAIALPWLESMMPAVSFGFNAAAKRIPRRLAFLYIPNGVIVPAWTPTAEGVLAELPATLEPLAPFKNDLLVFSGLTCDKARPHGDGPGDHARAMSAFLTGSQPRKTSGADIKVGISIDQFAAQKVGNRTKFPSLELGCDRGLQAGNCDSGYSCAYSANISWRGESTPMAKEIDPRLVFERLFTDGPAGEIKESQYKRNEYKKSILDFVADDANRLKGKISATDQRKLDEYLTGVRELETRINRAGLENVKAPPGVAVPPGIPKEYADHIRLLCDLLVLAFQGDLTRVSTFVFANEGSNRSYKFIDVPEGHHDLSHHGGNKEKMDKIKQINRFHTTQLGYLLGKLKAAKESDGSPLLDHCMLLYGSGNGDGNRHNHDNLPILMAGRGGGTFKTGRHVVYPRETPLTNLFLEMLDRMGAPAEKFGDSTGRLDGLTA